MTIPLDLIKPAIEAKVNAAVIEALGASDRLIIKLVEEIMTRKVDSNGCATGYNCNTPWLTWATRKCVEEAIVKAIDAHLADNKPKIANAIEAQMKKSESPLVKSIVAAMAEGIAKVSTNNYRINVTFSGG